MRKSNGMNQENHIGKGRELERRTHLDQLDYLALSFMLLLELDDKDELVQREKAEKPDSIY